MQLWLINTVCKKIFPNHLYLGSRLMGQDRKNKIVMRTAEKYCDVISYNMYIKSLADFPGPRRKYDKPFMSTEYHFGAMDRGMFNLGLNRSSSQEDRAVHYIEYVKSALENPYFVGTHWFQFQSQAITGRPRDGENYSIGLLDTADTPYPEMVKAIREIGYNMYNIRNP